MARLALATLLVLLVGGPIGCQQDPRAPFDLDSIDELDGSCVTVVHERLQPVGAAGSSVHRYVGDGAGSLGGWALITMTQDDLEQPELAIVRVPATPDEPPTPPLWLGFSKLDAVDLELRVGAVPGELWVLQQYQNISAKLYKLVPGFGVVASNNALANFPGADVEPGCPARFHRQLVFIDGRPHVFALPDCSESLGLDLHLLELDPDAAGFLTSWELSFEPGLNDPECVFGSCTLGPIGPGEATHVSDAERVGIGFTQGHQLGATGLSRSDVSLLDLRMTPTGPTARLVTFRGVWLTTGINLGPAQLAQDPFSVQLHVRNNDDEQDAALLRFDVNGELFVQVKASLPFDGPGRLVQLDDQSAMLHVADGELIAVPLIDVDSWPNWKPRTLLQLDDLVGFEPAGVGQLLLRREHEPPQVVQLHCLDPAND